MAERNCFVVMPIRKPGTPEHAHFRAVFNHIKPIIEAQGYTAIRADDVQKSGAITKDIVTRLGESDLVIADMTDLNPNVFYELGVRHALRGVGTLMILDESRTPDLPFDLSAYRVIKFTGDLAGIDSLTQALASYIQEAQAEDPSRRDNPVHDWFPMLPMNVLEIAEQSSAAPLRKEIRQLQDRLGLYEKAYGAELPGSNASTSPLSVVLTALSDAEDGFLPSAVLENARNSFEARDPVGFLQKVRVVMERNLRLPPTMFLALAQWANLMDMDEVVKALFEQALQLWPTETNLRHSYLVRLAHSEAPADRERARQGIAKELSIDISKEDLSGVAPDVLKDEMDLILVLLDTYQEDGMKREELELTKKLVKALPDSTQALRSYGRALKNSGDRETALKFYRQAIFCSDVEDTSAVWLGNDLHNMGLHRDAAEAYALACLLDPADAHNFAHEAEELSILIPKRTSPLAKQEQDSAVADGIDSRVVTELARCSQSCLNMDGETAERLRRALERVEAPSKLDEETAISREHRIELAQRLYSGLKTALTTPGAEMKLG